MKKEQSTRSKILASVKLLLDENVGLSFSVEDVAKRAGISKGGLLYHFASKEKLLSALVQNYCEELDAFIEAEIQQKNTSYSVAYVEACLTPEAVRASRVLIAVAAIDEKILEPMEIANRRWRQNLSSDLKDKSAGLALSLLMDGYLLNASNESCSVSRKELLDAAQKLLK